jgi:O-antigen ligase
MGNVDRGAALRAVVLLALLLGALFPPYGSSFLVAPAAVAAAGLLVWDLWRGRRLPAGTWFIVGLFAVLAVPLLWHTWATLPEYGQDKVLRLFTLTLLTAAAATLVRDRRDLTYLARGFLAVGFVLAIIALVGPVDHLGRSIGLPGTNPLWLARAIGLGLVSAVWLVIHRGWLLTPVLLSCLILAGGVFLTGSRGPALGTVAGLMVLGAAAVTVRLLREHRKVVAGLAAFGVLALASAVLVSQRYLVLLTNPTGDESTASRIDYWTATFDLIGDNPWGIGYGAWQETTELPAPYPHNLILEVTSEAGWVIGLAFVAAVVAVVVRLARRFRRDPASALVLALFAVEMVSVMLSGNINARTWFFLLALGWIVSSWRSGADGAKGLPRAGAAGRSAHPAHAS